MSLKASIDTVNHAGENKRHWKIYKCETCGSLVTACGREEGYQAIEWFPRGRDVDDDLPPKAKSYLTQAIASLHAPAGAVMLAASAIDAMLKAKTFVEGSLYARIDKAAADHVITKDMATWAHQVRLDGNDQRHADEDAGLPSQKDAERCVDFAIALGQFMFVLPARVTRGIEAASK